MGKPPNSRTKAARAAKAAPRRVDDVFAGRYPPRPEGGPVENVDAGWLLKAAGLAVLAALLCAYGTLCLLVYQGQWQLVLHPAPANALSQPPLEQNIRFGAAETGQPQLAGLWFPAADGSDGAPTLLYLADGTGNLLADADALQQLHVLPVNVFAFDYRGFGASAAQPHPDEVRMTEDAEAALDYLVNTRHVSPTKIVPYGVGLGSSLAATLASRHPALPAFIAESPRPDASELAFSDSRARLVPLHLFFHERFDFAGQLGNLKTPRLLLESGPSSSPAPYGFGQVSHAAGSPAMVVHLDPKTAADPRQKAQWQDSILRFLDEYLSMPPTALGAHPTR